MMTPGGWPITLDICQIRKSSDARDCSSGSPRAARLPYFVRTLQSHRPAQQTWASFRVNQQSGNNIVTDDSRIASIDTCRHAPGFRGDFKSRMPLRVTLKRGSSKLRLINCRKMPAPIQHRWRERLAAIIIPVCATATPSPNTLGVPPDRGRILRIRPVDSCRRLTKRVTVPAARVSLVSRFAARSFPGTNTPRRPFPCQGRD